MTTPKMSLKKDNPKKAAEPDKKKEAEVPEYPGLDNAKLGVDYRLPNGNIITRGKSE